MSSNDGNVKHTASLSKPVGTGRTPPVVAQNLSPRPVVVASAAPTRAAVSAETTGSIPPHNGPALSVGGWSANGGTGIVVAQGETADMLAKRYGVPTNAFLELNGLKSEADLQPGARIIVPIYIATATIAPREPEPRVLAEAPLRASPTPAAKPVVVEAERATKPAVLAGRPAVLAGRPAVLASRPAVSRLAKLEPAAPVKVVAATRLAAVPNRKAKDAAPLKVAAIAPTLKPNAKSLKAAPVKTAMAAVEPVKAASVKAMPPKPIVAAKTLPAPAKPEQVASLETKKASDAASAPAAAPAPTAPVAEATPSPEFRWPARGRIIQGFKGGAGGNDGINIAVPEGTAVKAAEGGVVAYAGSELKGYGNLVLIRHPNGFVSAYANNGEIDVKRGDAVKRGQVIAKSGQSGNVASPQLHFELRKGSQPVDPTSYLAGL